MIRVLLYSPATVQLLVLIWLVLGIFASAQQQQQRRQKRFVFTSFGWGPGGTPRDQEVAAKMLRDFELLSARANASSRMLTQRFDDDNRFALQSDAPSKQPVLFAAPAKITFKSLNNNVAPILDFASIQPNQAAPQTVNFISKLGLDPQLVRQWLQSRQQQQQQIVPMTTEEAATDTTPTYDKRQQASAAAAAAKTFAIDMDNINSSNIPADNANLLSFFLRARKR